MNIEQTLDLTPEQAMFELGMTNAPKTIDIQAKAAQERAERFDRICKRLGMTPVKFATLSVGLIEKEVRADYPGVPVDVNRLPQWVDEYVQSRR